MKCPPTPARPPHGSSRPARGAWVEIERFVTASYNQLCRAPQGARGLKCKRGRGRGGCRCRAPQGARGLKSSIFACLGIVPCGSRPARGAWVEIPCAWMRATRRRSRPARGAWVEIAVKTNHEIRPIRRAPQGARGLKCGLLRSYGGGMSRAPQGARGLKCLDLLHGKTGQLVAPRKGRVG